MKGEEANKVALKMIKFLETGKVPDGLFAPDIFLDFILPKWRVQAQGYDDMVQARFGSHPGTGKVPCWCCDPIPSGFVLEVEECWTLDGKDWHCVTLLRDDAR